MVEAKSRVVVISHPAFNSEGKEGIEECNAFGNQILAMVKELSSPPYLRQIPEKDRKQHLEYLNQFRIFTRKLPKDLL